jgi:hypothetical protein
MTQTRKPRTPAPSTPRAAADLLADLRAAAPALLADPAQTDLVVVAMPGSGTPHVRKVDASTWWRKGDGTLWALCYAVAADASGTPSKSKRAGCVWGHANSAASAAADVARKSTDLRNVRDVLVPGSVFMTPAYVVPAAAADAVKALLVDAATAYYTAADAHTAAAAAAAAANRKPRAPRKPRATG